MDRPSFTNLDQAKNELSDFSSRVSNEMQNTTSKSIQDLQQLKNSFEKELTDLKNKVNNIGVVDGLTEELKNANEVAKTFSETVNSLQRVDISTFINNLNEIRKSINDSYELTQKFNSTGIGNDQQLNNFMQQIENMKSTLSSFISTTNLFDIKDSDLELVRTKILSFVKEISGEGFSAASIADNIVNATKDPRISNAFNEMLNPIGNIVSKIPDSFNVSGGPQGNELTQLMAELKRVTEQTFMTLNTRGAMTTFESPDVVNSRAQANSSELKNNQVEELNRKLESLHSLKALSGDFDKNMNTSAKEISNLQNSLGDVVVKSMTGALNSDQKSKLESSGFGDKSLESMLSMLSNAEGMGEKYKKSSSDLSKSFAGLDSAEKKYRADPSQQNLVELISMADQVETQINQAMESAAKLINLTSSMASGTDISKELLQTLPDEMLKISKSMNEMFQGNSSSATDLLIMLDKFNVGSTKMGEELKENLKASRDYSKEMSENITETSNDFNDSNSGKRGGWLQIFGSKGSKAESVLNGIGAMTRGADKMSNFQNSLGLGVGIPTSVNGLKRYFSDSVDYYKEFGRMDYDTAMAVNAQGSTVSQEVLDANRSRGIELYKKTNGTISEKEYSSMYDQLVSKIQGQYGGTKSDGLNELGSMTDMALGMNKVYGVDSADAINTLYKELRMSADETEKAMFKMANTAQNTNIPVSDYIKSVTQLSTSYRDMGVNIAYAQNAMSNFTLQGMTLSDAKSMSEKYAQGVNTFGTDPGRMALYGVTSGAFSDPYQAMNYGVNRWDKNGNVIQGREDMVMQSMQAEIDTYSQMFGSTGNEDAQDYFMNRYFKQSFGLTDRQASMATQNFKEGNQEDFFKVLKEAEEGNSEVTLKDQADLEEKLVNASENIDELTKANVALKGSQMDLAEMMKGAIDSIGIGLKESIDSLLPTLNNIAAGLVGSAPVQATLSNPVTSMVVGAGSGLFGNILAGKGFSWLKDKVTNIFGGGKNKSGGKNTGGTKIKGGKAGKAGTNVVDDVIEGQVSFFDDATKQVQKGSKKLKNGVKSSADEIATGAANAATDVTRGGSKVFTGFKSLSTKLSGSSNSLVKTLGKVGTKISSAFDDVGKIFSSSGGIFNKIFGPLATIAGGAFTYYDAKQEGKSDTEAGSMALGSTIFSAVGTFFGGWLGGVAGDILGAKVGEGAYGSSTHETGVAGIDSSIDPKTSSMTGGKSEKSDPVKTVSSMSTEKRLSPEEQKNLAMNERQLSGLNRKQEEALGLLDDSKKINDKSKKADEEHFKKVETSNKETALTMRDIAMGIKDTNDLLKDQTKNIKDLKTTLSPRQAMDKINKGDKDVDQDITIPPGGNSFLHKDLREKTEMTAEDINEFIAGRAGKDSKMLGMGEAFIKASEASGLDPLYLVAHAGLETGWGDSDILKKKNNWFGIGAFNEDPEGNAWSYENLEQGIIDGAKLIAKDYTNDGQETIWKMISDKNGHNYAQNNDGTGNKQWAITLSQIMGEFGGTSYSGTSNDESSSSSSSTSTDKKFTSPRQAIGSKIYDFKNYEYTNGAKRYDAVEYKNDEMNTTQFTDGQAMARKMYLDAKQRYNYGKDIETGDDWSSSYNSKGSKSRNSNDPRFNINISVPSESERKMDAMANEIKVALSTIVEQYMGTSSKIATANYNRR